MIFETPTENSILSKNDLSKKNSHEKNLQGAPYINQSRNMEHYGKECKILEILDTGCSLIILFFSQEFSKVCHLSLASCYLLYKKFPVNSSDCTLALR